MIAAFAVPIAGGNLCIGYTKKIWTFPKGTSVSEHVHGCVVNQTLPPHDSAYILHTYIIVTRVFDTPKAPRECFTSQGTFRRSIKSSRCKAPRKSGLGSSQVKTKSSRLVLVSDRIPTKRLSPSEKSVVLSGNSPDLVVCGVLGLTMSCTEDCDGHI